MAIENTKCSWKPSLFTQYRIRIANALRLAQRQEQSNNLRRQIALIESENDEILKHIESIDFARIKQKLNSWIISCQIEQKRTLEEYNRIKRRLIQIAPKLLIGHFYLRHQNDDIQIETRPATIKKRRKRLKLTLEQKWKKGIGEVYRKLQSQRDRQHINSSISHQPLPVINDYPLDDPPIICTEDKIDEIKEHEFIPPPPIDEIIIPFQTPPAPSKSIDRQTPTSDRSQLNIDDTIVKPHRLIDKTLGNISRMSFHIEPDQCSSPKTGEKKKKSKAKKLMLPPALPPAPIFSSTAIFDTHAFFTQTNTKTKKQKKKIDISRQPVIMTTNNVPKKKIRMKKSSPYDFQDDESLTLSQTKGAKLLTDDIITARFAKNSHFQSHQTSMASIKSSKSQHKSNEYEHKKTNKNKKNNILGIGRSSPLKLSSNLTLSPGQLSLDDNDDTYQTKSISSSKDHNRTRKINKTKRTRVK